LTRRELLWLYAVVSLALVVTLAHKAWGQESCIAVPLAIEVCAEQAESIDVRQWNAGLRVEVVPPVVQFEPPMCEPCPPTYAEELAVARALDEHRVTRILALEAQLRQCQEGMP